MAIRAETFIGACTQRGYDFFAGVPCSFIKPLINEVIARDGLTYVGATSEGEALGIAAGAWMAGRRTVSMCQDSGLGNMVNPLTSLNQPFEIPTLLVTTWRGQPGLKDEPQHEQIGRILCLLLECLELPWRFFPEADDEVDAVVGEAVREMEDTRRPFVLVMRQGAVKAGREIPDPVVRPPSGIRRDRRTGHTTLSRTDAVRAVLNAWPSDAPIVATTGMTGRELFTLCDRPTHLYTVGSMGCASAIALGLAIGGRGIAGERARPILVLDGDGAALMKLGNLATIGREAPGRFVHLVLNNGTHDSTGGQHTSASHVDFAAVAVACGYASSARVDDTGALYEAIELALSTDGPHLIEIAIRPGSPPGIGRPTLTPREVGDRFRDAIAGR